MAPDAFIHKGLNASLKIDSQGSRVRSDGGLLLVRESDLGSGLGELIAQHLTDSRQRKNTQLLLAGLLGQSVHTKPGRPEGGVEEACVEGTEKTGFPGLRLSRQGEIGARWSQRRRPKKRLHFGGSEVGGWV